MKKLISILLAATLSAAPSFAAGHLSDDHVEVRNLSTRGVVSPGEGTMITGISVEGDGSDYVPVLFRGIGPTLADFGVTDPAGNPAISLFSGTTLMTSNDDWASSQASAIRASGYAPSDSSEAAIIANLVPGTYTVHLSGDHAGVALAEAYFLEEKSVPQNLIDAGNFTTLVAAVQAAGLLDTLLGPGPYTLFRTTKPLPSCPAAPSKVCSTTSPRFPTSSSTTWSGVRKLWPLMSRRTRLLWPTAT